MLEKTASDYAEYIKLDVSKELKGVHDLIDSMLTRLEELSSVLQMVKSKNLECATAVRSIIADDVTNYKMELASLIKRISTLEIVIKKLNDNAVLLEKHVEKAELDLGISNENKIRNFLNTFLRKSKDVPDASVQPLQKLELNISQYFHKKSP